MASTENVSNTLGAILVGCLFSTVLSSLVGVQTFYYFRVYTKDTFRLKAMVIGIWFLDAAHTILACASTWDYLIVNFGNESVADNIPITIGLTIAITAFLTWVVHLYFCFRVLRFSQGNWYLGAPLIALTFARLIAASITTAEIAFTVLSMICWIVMPNNLIYFGFHLAISKLYANSLLATLNTRRTLRGRFDKSSEPGAGDHPLPVLFPSTLSRHGRNENSGFNRSRCEDERTPSKLEIGVEKTVQYDVDGVTIDLSQHAPRPSRNPSTSAK
ncbi:uncharacterized protein STEHIDRAFT_160602 [Stereum hirsutum FP-91666 SS1]|uniref:uncharacterized protein n=1 Tax=Stereum hirsutum (strain FP-91666) TaxID=721885 RepID=UPI0004449CC5|nr:uncharacterized protein STEHIDRAFT_160602 [Stereum hirsutum FP-91666 SS1]EIM82993.1 hypothetical protein STEHIDRAFT_160602 [Stereum hirsutum FP-91666 SS1]